LDGTKEFLHRNGEFTVNIALIEHGEAVMGVVYAPAIDMLYLAEGNHAWKEEKGQRKPITVSNAQPPLERKSTIGRVNLCSMPRVNPFLTPAFGYRCFELIRQKRVHITFCRTASGVMAPSLANWSYSLLIPYPFG